MITGALWGPLMNIRGVFLGAVCVVSCFVMSGRAQAQAIYLEIPAVQGEVVTPAAFANQIEVLSISFGGSKPCGSNPLSFSDISLMKRTDKASVDFLAALRDHTVYPTATVRFTNPTGSVYQSYTLTNAVLTSVQTSGSAAGDARTTESVSMTFSQMVVSYQYFDGSGKSGGAAETTTITNTVCP